MGVRKLDASAITEAVRELCIEINYMVPEEMVTLVKRARELEESPLGRQVLDLLIRNQELAAEGEYPYCQDTGYTVIFIDLWEGMLALAAALVVLIGMLALRISRSAATRRLIAVVITVVAFGAAALAVTVAVGAQDRFVQTEGLDAYARTLSEELDLPFEQVRRDIEEIFRQDLLVETAPGIWVTVAGGVLAGIGGILSLAWVRRREAAAQPGGTGPDGTPPSP